MYYGTFNDDNLHYILSYQISKSILKTSNEPTFGFYWLRTGSVIAIKPRLLIAPKIIFNLVFSTDVRAMIRTSFYTEQRVPFGKHIPTYQKMMFSQGFERSVPNTNSSPKGNLERAPFSMLTTSGFELLIKRLITISQMQKTQSMKSSILTTPSRIWDSLNSHWCLGSQYMILNKNSFFCNLNMAFMPKNHSINFWKALWN